METYLIKASAILGIFLLTYQLLLRKETFFRLNRFFLLTGMVAALGIFPVDVLMKWAPLRMAMSLASRTPS